MNIPEGLPVLSQGAHSGPKDGACFMEYVSVLAGEPWSDSPKCVEIGLAMVMQTINDYLPDADRHLLVPLLGRGIGLAPKPHIDSPTWAERQSLDPVECQQRMNLASMDKRRYISESHLLRRRAFDIFGRRTLVRFPDDERLASDPSSYFRNKIDEVWSRRSVDYIKYLVDMATKLHESYEEAMDELGWDRKVYTRRCSVPEVTALLSYPELFDSEQRMFTVL